MLLTLFAASSLLTGPVLPPGSETLSAMEPYTMAVRADRAADDAWLAVKDRAGYDARRRELRERMIEALGGLPSRTPLNPVAKPSFEGDGYRVENVRFESLPGVYVTANLYLPTATAFSAPYPAVVITCGHSANGKASATSQRGAVQLAKAGFAAFIYDPFEQGERRSRVSERHNTNGHNAIGSRAALLGWSMARFRIWDGMRAIDYVLSRPEVDGSRLGYMGQSGGGTMTSLMMAVDERIRCAAPSCYLTNFRVMLSHMSPQDAEQNIFGQLSFGLNHLAYPLLNDIPVRFTGRYGDFFPFAGTYDTYLAASAVAERLGEKGRFSAAFAQGPHGWMESTRASSVAWMRGHLKGETSELAIGMEEFRALDIGFDIKACDAGIPEERGWSSPEGKIWKIPGYRDVYTVLSDRLAEMERARAGVTETEKSAAAVRLAKVRRPADSGYRARPAKKTAGDLADAEAIAFMKASGYAFPTVLLLPKTGVKPGTRPVLLAGDAGRGVWESRAKALVAEGRPVLVADLFGYGEIGKPKFTFYGAKAYPEESAAVTLYLLGESAIGWRASELLVAAEYLAKRFSASPELIASGTVAIAAAHAKAADRGAFASVAVEKAPPAWGESLRDPVEELPFAGIVNGALAVYDWPELLN